MTVDDSPEAQRSSTARTSELVFLLHGFGGRPLLMSRIARYLQRNDYAVRNWTYGSMRRHIAYHADRLRDELTQIDNAGQYARVHFVTHSLGGIVVRNLLCQSFSMLTGIGRIVMLAPPNSGSHLSRIGSLLLSGLCPILREISDRQTSFVNRLSEPCNVEVGIIAGSGDWVVRQSSTHLKTEQDHIVLRGGHLRLPFLRACVEQTEHFLRHGKFDHGEDRKAESAAPERMISAAANR